ncbi:protein NSP-INTERACTING KINASE 1-like isoform X2 [Durio zibethinus]|uniref:Protein NSP-INTERACTING KINASE 1-like isoform X2 n=1 Tax=Durio zibethinus TaxID=66656 RepID=A0A6P5XZ20_DURZI|nr:protein NSP-INTERACTING KINASE 1-like isoform X2 [Durio zibethinus]
MDVITVHFGVFKLKCLVIGISSYIIFCCYNSMEMRKGISDLLCCLAFFCLSTSTLVSSNHVEVPALMDIKSFLVDPHGVLDSWDDSSPDPCSWTMVTCSPDGLVVDLGAPSQDLSGTLAPAIGNLTNIEHLLLQNNHISGHIPSGIGSLSKLQTLDLSNNTFSGQIPSTISHLQSLQYLRLNNNSLSGEIPASLSNLMQLKFIDLSFNNFSGHVPIFPDKMFNIEGNPYICTDGAEKVGCADRDTASLPSSSKAKLTYPSGIYNSGIFYVILGFLFS